jgi:hypothetical protein
MSARSVSLTSKRPITCRLRSTENAAPEQGIGDGQPVDNVGFDDSWAIGNLENISPLPLTSPANSVRRRFHSTPVYQRHPHFTISRRFLQELANENRNGRSAIGSYCCRTLSPYLFTAFCETRRPQLGILPGSRRLPGISRRYTSCEMSQVLH